MQLACRQPVRASEEHRSHFEDRPPCRRPLTMIDRCDRSEKPLRDQRPEIRRGGPITTAPTNNPPRDPQPTTRPLFIDWNPLREQNDERWHTQATTDCCGRPGHPPRPTIGGSNSRAYLPGRNASESTKKPFSRDAYSQETVTTAGGRPLGASGAHRANNTCVRNKSSTAEQRHGPTQGGMGCVVLRVS